MYTKKEHDKLSNQYLDNAKSMSDDFNIVIIGTKCCIECEKMNGAEFSINDAIKNPPLPNKKCTRKPFCICCYAMKSKED